MKTNLSLLVFILMPLAFCSAQDAAITGWNHSGSSSVGDGVAFVLLRDFADTEDLFITEDEYSDFAGAFNSGEGHLRWVPPSGGLTEGSIVTVIETSAGTYTASAGTVTSPGGYSWSFLCQDEMYLYSADDAASPWNNITEVHCFAWAAVIVPPTDQQISTDWPDGITIAFNIGGSGGVDADFMTGATRVSTTLADLLDGTNWNQTVCNNGSNTSPSFSTESFTTQMISLPVEWLNFDGKVQQEKVRLDWQTATETNNEYFSVEHSTDGRSFFPIGKINGQGTTQQTSYYDFTHSTPIAGVNYYRIQQVDYDGANAYSDVISISVDKQESTRLNIAPNPFQDQVNISWPGSSIDDNIETVVEVHNIHGALVRSIRINNSNTQLQLDLNQLESGVYLISLSGNDGRITTPVRVVKQ